MDLSDGRVVAYDALPRWAGGSPRAADLLDAALRRAAELGSPPVLVHVDPSLLVDPAFGPISHLRSARCSPSEVIWMLPDPRHHPAGGIAARRRYATTLLEEGYRSGLDGLAPLTVSWREVVEARPAFLVLDPQAIRELEDESTKAALAGLLAFSGRIGARLVAKGVDSAATAQMLMDVGIFYGIGDRLHEPVVLEGSPALEGDLVVRSSWFKGRAVRNLSAAKDEAGVHLVPEATRPQVIDDRHMAALLAQWFGQLSDAPDPDSVLQALADIVPQVVEFDRMAVFEADWDRYVLRPRVLIGEVLQPLTDVTYTLNLGITGWAFLRGEPYRCARTGEHPEAAPIPGQKEADESLLVIPLISSDRRLGVLDLWRDGTDQFSEHDLERAALIGKLGADAWRAAAQRAELAARVVTDTATGLLNKRWWEELAPREAAQALRSKSTIAVLLLDLDTFKQVNDSYGHGQGDVVLNRVARTLSGAVRSGDAVVRYGGDEFVLLLRDCDEGGAVEVASEVRRALSRVTRAPGDPTPITASIGLALFPEHGTTLEDVVAHADVAMYRAKARGRDQVALYSEGSWPTSRPRQRPSGRLLPMTDETGTAGRQPIHVYGTQWCGDCKRAKQFFGEQRVHYRFTDVDADPDALAYVEQVNGGKRIIPVILFPDGSTLVEPSNAQLASKLGIATSASRTFYDLIVICSGPCGLTAALYAAREGIETLVVERGGVGGQAGVTERLDNFPGFPEGVTGSEFAERLRRQAERFGVEILAAQEVTGIDIDGMFRKVTTADGSEYCSYAVLLALGSTYRRLGVPGEDDFIGAGVHFCATCDGAFYRGQEVLVVGGGNSAGEEGLFLTKFASHVTIATRDPELTASKVVIEKVEEHQSVDVLTNVNTVELKGEGHLETVVMESSTTGERFELHPAAMFVFIGLSPNSAVVGDVVEQDGQGFVVTDAGMQTSVPGVFAAGDVRSGSTKQAASAAGEGAAAAIAIRRYLEPLAGGMADPQMVERTAMPAVMDV